MLLNLTSPSQNIGNYMVQWNPLSLSFPEEPQKITIAFQLKSTQKHHSKLTKGKLIETRRTHGKKKINEKPFPLLIGLANIRKPDQFN